MTPSVLRGGLLKTRCSAAARRRDATTLWIGGLLAIVLTSCGEVPHDPRLHAALFSEHSSSMPTEPGQLEIEPPPFSEGVFPCSDCHEADLPVKGTRRQLRRAHQEIVLRHDEQNRWCLDCHSVVDFDKLHLASGELIDFEDSHRLCGQCHGDKHRDWLLGIHGRRSGNWDGAKTYLLCVHCHYSHDPSFKPIEPKSPPIRPQRTP